MQINKIFDVAIVGGGVAGTSLLYTLATFSKIESVVLFEKYDELAMLNSNPKANSQTLHAGDIETNYSYEKAHKVKRAASMVENYIRKTDGVGSIGYVRDKMVLAVGEEEIDTLRKRYEHFHTLYPYLEWWDADFLEYFEPALLQGREEAVAAMGARGQISTVNYKRMSESFVKEALQTDKQIELRYNEEVTRIVRQDDGGFTLYSPTGTHRARSVVVNAGAYSLLLAQSMGYGEEYAILPIGGSFFFTKEKMLESKVYTMQNPKLPFAAIHADPDLTQEWHTRFGPTAFALPKLERYHRLHLRDLLDALNLDSDVTRVYLDLFKDATIRRYILKNFLEEIPVMGKEVFIKDARKIIPSLKTEDIRFADGYGGMRPQIIDKTRHELLLGEAKIDEEGVIFNMTPSPGATSSLAIAHEDAKRLCTYLKVAFDESSHRQFLGEA